MAAVYLSHPEVTVQPDVPVPDWPLSPHGVARLRDFAVAGWLRGLSRIVASPERKAQETAGRLADVLGLPVETAADSHENDRSATGYLPPAAFEAAADAFFAFPDVSFRGWETARAAQARIMGAARRVAAADGVIMVGHGAVGTLLRQAVRGEAISRAGDQPAGGGCLFAFDLGSGQASARWARMEDCRSAPPGLAPAPGNPDALPRCE